MEFFERAEMYRNTVAECRRQAAASFIKTSVREHWLGLAAQYEKLAEQALRLSAARHAKHRAHGAGR